MSTNRSIGARGRLVLRTTYRLAIASGLATLFLIAGARAAAVGPTQSLPLPEHITQDARAEVKARMARHGETMSSLVRAVVLLDRPTIRTLATRIADEEVIARAGAGGQQKPPALPREFFAAQDDLSTNARQLAAAAVEGGDDRVLSERFAAVTRTCVTCHSIYLHGRPDPSPFGPKAKDGSARK
jgi:cytochrome c556